MPPVTRWFVKTSFVYLILALLTGFMLAAGSAWVFFAPAKLFFPTYFHLLAEGWITMLIIGVVFWMFPKYTLENPHRSEKLAWASYVLLNVGLLLRIISEPANASGGNSAYAWAIVLTLAALLQLAGGIAFVVNSWGRVKVK